MMPGRRPYLPQNSRLSLVALSSGGKQVDSYGIYWGFGYLLGMNASASPQCQIINVIAYCLKKMITNRRDEDGSPSRPKLQKRIESPVIKKN